MHGQLSAHVGKLGFCCMPYMACNFHAALNFVSRCTGGGKSRGRFVKYDKYRVFRRAFSCYCESLMHVLVEEKQRKY